MVSEPETLSKLCESRSGGKVFIQTSDGPPILEVLMTALTNEAFFATSVAAAARDS
jgi:hypothetical protein